jgi:plasmid stabilization system protein ParE
MSFRAQITRKAARDIAKQFQWLAENRGTAAKRWRTSLLHAIDDLEENPRRYPEALESEWYGEGLRELIFGKRKGAYRILFEIREDVVVILRVRHSAQDQLTPDDI